jgi:phosphatidylglycerophosphate synthase
MAKVGRSHSVAVSFFGKLKTTAQMVAILLLLYHAPLGALDAQWLGRWLLDIAAFLTFWSMLHYLLQAWRDLRGQTVHELTNR